MAKIKADRELCQGYANCVVGAGGYFDIDDEGTVLLLKTEVTGDDLAMVTEAAYRCPVAALEVEDE